MFPLAFTIMMFASAGNAVCDCVPNEWAQVVGKTEGLILHKASIYIPRDPVGTVYAGSCVRLVFNIDINGMPVHIKIDHSSKNRIFDLAAEEALRGYRFKTGVGGSRDVHSLVFRSN